MMPFIGRLKYAITPLRILLLIFVVAAVYFRFTDLSRLVWIHEGYDDSRDTLVARHIAQYSEHLWRGPYAAGGLGTIANSPLYYYILAFFWWCTRSSYGTLATWAAISLLTLWLGYRVGNRLGGRVMAVAAVSLMAIHPTLVAVSRHISQPYLMPIISLAVIDLMTLEGEVTIIRLCLFIFALAAALHIHYSGLILMPVGVLWFVWQWIRLCWKRPINYYSIVLPYGAMLIAISTWLWLTYRYRVGDQEGFFLSFLAGETGAHFQFQKVIDVIVDMVWDRMQFANLYMGITGVVALCSVWWLRKSKQFVAYGWFISLLVVATVSVMLYGGFVGTSYVIVLVPLYLLVFAQCISQSYRRNRLLGLLLWSLILCDFGMRMASQVRAVPQVSYEVAQQEIAKVIRSDYDSIASPTTTPTYILAMISTGGILSYDLWGTGGIWYSLEDLYHQRLIRISDSGVNFDPIEQHPSMMYLICDHRSWYPQDESLCLTLFRKKRIYVGKETLVRRADEYTLWRFPITVAVPSGRYNEIIQRQFSR
jgi:hypothetical protein